MYMKAPLGCVDLLAVLSISCANGFELAKFEFSDIQLGLPWLSVNWIDVVFTTQAKSVNAVFSFTPDKSVCLTPYWALEGGGNSIAGVSLKALLFSYTWNGATFRAGHLFDEDGWQPYLNYPGYDLAYGWAWDGTLTYYNECKVPRGYDEYLGLQIGADTCCGGESNASVFWWFDTGDSVGLFDVEEVRASVEAGIGSNLTLMGGVGFKGTGPSWLRFGGTVSW